MTGASMGATLHADAPVIPASPTAQAANSLGDLLSVLADPAKAKAMVETIKAETAAHEAARLAAQDALAAANIRHAEAEKRERALAQREGELETTATRHANTTSALGSREAGVRQQEQQTAAAKSDLEQRQRTFEASHTADSALLETRERNVTAREQAVAQREQVAEQKIAEAERKLDGMRRIAVG